MSVSDHLPQCVTKRNEPNNKYPQYITKEILVIKGCVSFEEVDGVPYSGIEPTARLQVLLGSALNEDRNR